MAIEQFSDGGFAISGKRDIDLLRMNTLIRGLKIEMTGMRLCRGRTCYSLIKSEYGFKGNKARVLAQACRLREQMEARRADTPDGARIIVPETPPMEKDDVDQGHL